MDLTRITFGNHDPEEKPESTYLWLFIMPEGGMHWPFGSRTCSALFKVLK